MLARFLSPSSYFAALDRLGIVVTRDLAGSLWKLEGSARGLHIDGFRTLVVIGRPTIRVAYGSRIEIGRGVVLMSSSRFCLSASLYAPIKLITHTSSAAISIGAGASLNGTSVVCRSSRIVIGARTMVGPNAVIVDSPYHPLWPLDARNRYPGTHLDREVEIGDDVWIGMQVIVLPGAKIGSGTVIGAGSIVSGEIPPNCLAVGRPARVVRRLDATMNAAERETFAATTVP